MSGPAKRLRDEIKELVRLWFAGDDSDSTPAPRLRAIADEVEALEKSNRYNIEACDKATQTIITLEKEIEDAAAMVDERDELIAEAATLEAALREIIHLPESEGSESWDELLAECIGIARKALNTETTDVG